MNRAPQILSLPATLASGGEIYTYPVEATDPDGDDLTYQLLEGPAGMSVDPDTGVLSWGSPVGGIYPVVVAAFDPSGAGATQGFTLTVRVNQPPQILSVNPPTQALVGDLYRYDLRAQDPNGDPLTYELVDGPEGMTLDELGRVDWLPDAPGGPIPVELGVRDAQGAEVTQSFEITVTADQVPPQVQIRFSLAPIDIGDAVTVFVIASDDVALGSLSLTVDGDPVPLNLNGFGTVTPDRLGMIPVVATATDRAGNQATTSPPPLL